MLLLPIFTRHWTPDSENLVLPLLVHVGVWSAVGGAAGMAFGMGVGGRGRVIRGLLGGLVGGALGAAAYELIGAFAFPLDRTTDPVSISGASRLLARFSVGIMVAVGVATAVRERAPKSAARRS